MIDTTDGFNQLNSTHYVRSDQINSTQLILDLFVLAKVFKIKKNKF